MSARERGEGYVETARQIVERVEDPSDTLHRVLTAQEVKAIRALAAWVECDMECGSWRDVEEDN